MRTINRWRWLKKLKGTGGSIFDYGDCLFHIPVQQLYSSTALPLDLTGNGNDVTDAQTDGVTGVREFKIAYNSDLDTVNLALGEIFWDDATKTPKWVNHFNCGSNYLGINYLFQNTKSSPYRDLMLFPVQRTSATSPSIEKVCWYLQLTPGDILTFDGDDFTFGGEKIRF